LAQALGEIEGRAGKNRKVSLTSLYKEEISQKKNLDLLKGSQVHIASSGGSTGEGAFLSEEGEQLLIGGKAFTKTQALVGPVKK